jgi:hypothetical protein
LAYPAQALAGAVALVYAIFAVVALLLVRRQASCGCFGESDTPTTVEQSLISGALAIGVLAAALAGAHGARWIVNREAAAAVTLVVAIAGAVYAIVLAYTALPAAWRAWEPASTWSRR